MRTSWATVLLPVAIVVGAVASACGSQDDAGTTTTASATTTGVSGSSTSGPAPGASSGGNGSVDGSPATTGGAPAPAVTGPSATELATTAATPAAGLVLLPEGFDVVAFGASVTDTVDAMSAVIGPPVSVGQPFQDGPTSFRSWAAWEHLDITFSGSSEDVSFSGYEFGRRFVDANGNPTEDEPWAPNEWQAQTATVEGLRPASPTGDLAAGHATLYAPDCGRPLVPVGVMGGAGTPGQQLFLQPQEQGLFVRLAADGTIFSIGAQAAPNPFICDGAG